MLICRNAVGVHGQKKVGNPCSIVYAHSNSKVSTPVAPKLT